MATLPRCRRNKLNKQTEKKKGMGVSTFAHPWVQAFALPLRKDKQRCQPTPRDVIFAVEYYIPYYIYSTWRDIIHPNADVFVALPLCEDSKLRSLNSQNSNVRKRLSLWPLPYKRHGRPPVSIDVCRVASAKRRRKIKHNYRDRQIIGGENGGNITIVLQHLFSYIVRIPNLHKYHSR